MNLRTMNPTILTKICERFISKTIENKITGCLEWQGWTDKKGYGDFWLNGENYKAHRVSLMLQNIDVPDNLFVCHKCDNPRCVNPNHLFLGTQSDNEKDKVAKGRHKGQNQNIYKTHCLRGHELKGSNLYEQLVNGKIKRSCRTCKALHSRTRRKT